jgi:uncharacterized membrane protein
MRHLTHYHPYLLVFALAISYLAGVEAGDQKLMESPFLAIALWLFAVALIVAPYIKRDSSGIEDQRPRWEIPAIAGLTLVAFLVRVVDFETIPWLLTGDEGSVGLSAVEFIDGTHNNLFSVSWFSFPSLFFTIPALSIRLFGQSIFALRLPSALIGALTVPVLYWCILPIFKRSVALLSAAYLSTFHFHVHFSRLGINNVWDAFFITLFWGLFWRAWNMGRRRYFVFAGLILGLSQFFYVSSRVIPILLLAWIMIAVVRGKGVPRETVYDLIVMLLTAVVVAMPLIRFYFRHPDEFFAPFNRVVILGQPLYDESQRIGDPVWLLLWDQLRYSLLAFTSTVLRVWYPEASMLLRLPGALFLIGVFLTLKKPFDLRNSWLLLLLLSAIIAVTITDYVPTASRYVHIAPTVSVLIAVALDWMQSLIQKVEVRWMSKLSNLIPILLVVAMVLDVNFYFGEYSTEKRFGDLNSETAMAIADAIRGYDPGHPVYLLGLPRMGFITHASIRYLASEVTRYDVEPTLTSPPTWELSTPTTFIVLPERRAELEMIKQSFPGGHETTELGKDGDALFMLYETD